ncbi:MAG: glyoxalase [Bacteroidia bacterium]|nr:glyoxalase [Bacteroidia bacterium]
MLRRSEALLQSRPDVPSAALNPEMTAEERFQNTTLRPILQTQNNLLLAVFRHYIGKHKNAYFALGSEAREGYIENAIQKDIKFRNALKGMIIGQFTLEEYEGYKQHSSALNKRMMQMVINRIKDQMQLFEAPVLLQ